MSPLDRKIADFKREAARAKKIDPDVAAVWDAKVKVLETQRAAAIAPAPADGWAERVEAGALARLADIRSAIAEGGKAARDLLRIIVPVLKVTTTCDGWTIEGEADPGALRVKEPTRCR